MFLSESRERERERESCQRRKQGNIIYLARTILQFCSYHILYIFLFEQNKKVQKISFVRLLSFLSFSLYHTPFQKWYVLSNDCRSRSACTTTTTTATNEFGTHLTINSIKDFQGCSERRIIEIAFLFDYSSITQIPHRIFFNMVLVLQNASLARNTFDISHNESILK